MDDKNKEEKELERDELLFSLISESYNSEEDRLNIIDDKASKLIVFVGVLIGLLSSFGSILIRDIPKTDYYYSSYVITFIISIGFLIGSFIFGLWAYRIKKFKVVPKTSTMIKWGDENKDKKDILRIISMERSKAVEENETELKNKISFIKRGYIALVIGIMITLFFICFVLFTYTPQ